MSPAVRRPNTDDFRWFVGVPLRPQTYLNLLYLGLAFPLGIAYFVFVVLGLSLGVSLAIFVVGIPILLLVVLAALGIAAFERWLADRLLAVPSTDTSEEIASPEEDSPTSSESDATDERSIDSDEPSTAVEPSARSSPLTIQPPTELGETAEHTPSSDRTREPSESEDDRPPWRRALAVLIDTDTWKAVLFLPLKFVFGIVAIVTMVTALSTGVSMLLTPLYYSEPGLYVGIVTDRPVELHPTLHIGWNRLLITLETVITIGFWRIERLWQALIVAVAGGLLTLTTLHLLNGIATAAGRTTNFLLRDAYSPFESL